MNVDDGWSTADVCTCVTACIRAGGCVLGDGDLQGCQGVLPARARLGLALHQMDAGLLRARPRRLDVLQSESLTGDSVTP